MRFNLITVLLACGASSVFAQNAIPVGANAGVLDRPLPPTISEKPGKPGVSALSLRPSLVAGVVTIRSQAELRQEVVKEQKILEKLDRSELQKRAVRGERAAQVVLGGGFCQRSNLVVICTSRGQ